MGVKIEWVALPWEGVLPGLEAGKFDMVAGPATITKARMARYRFLPPIGEATDALMKRKGRYVGHEAGATSRARLWGPARPRLNWRSSRITRRRCRLEGDGPRICRQQRSLCGSGGRPPRGCRQQPHQHRLRGQAKRSDTFEVVDPPFGPKSYFGYIIPNDSDHAASGRRRAGRDPQDQGRRSPRGDAEEVVRRGLLDTPDAVKEPAL